MKRLVIPDATVYTSPRGVFLNSPLQEIQIS